MKNFKSLPNCPSWNELLRILSKDQCFLYLTDDNNFTFGWGLNKTFEQNESVNFNRLDNFINQNSNQYIMGFFSFDLKNEIENLNSNNKDFMEFPNVFLAVPEHTILVQNDIAVYFGEEKVENVQSIINQTKESNRKTKNNNIKLLADTPKNVYLENLKAIKDHIQRGDIYEMNYCINFSAKVDQFNPISTFTKLYHNTKAPFSSYINCKFGSILSASPERFIKKKNDTICSQPIKGTAPRNKDKSLDEQSKNNLATDVKERAENVMIVDLVRNDLSKIANKNSVEVSELFGIYSFKSVHQLISTVNCKIKRDINFSYILKSTFPMGSMTGAPKINALKYAEKYESFKRNIYSGSIALFDPFGNFDANVVIRSIIYNNKTNVISAPVGGAITIKSNPENEYEECLIKLKATQNSL